MLYVTLIEMEKPKKLVKLPILQNSGPELTMIQLHPRSATYKI